ncbi:hypothetical protein AB0L56_14625 [Streptomyces sp. NPDC052079]
MGLSNSSWTAFIGDLKAGRHRI